MGKSELYELLKQIVAQVPCSVCSQPFDMHDIHVLGRRGDVWMLTVHCTNCDTRGLVFAQMEAEGIAVYESELEPDEQEWFESLPPIGVDDVLDAHRFLRDFEGDVYDLLGIREAPVEE